jgi:hypothetical protein
VVYYRIYNLICLFRFKDGILLAGILHMHRITDNRMAGSPLKNPELLKKLCGEDALSKLVLVKTMWEWRVEKASIRASKERTN